MNATPNPGASGVARVPGSAWERSINRGRRPPSLWPMAHTPSKRGARRKSGDLGSHIQGLYVGKLAADSCGSDEQFINHHQAKLQTELYQNTKQIDYHWPQ